LCIGILLEDFGFGGVQRHTVDLIHALKARGHSVKALCFRNTPPMPSAVDLAPIVVSTPRIFSLATAKVVSSTVEELDLQVLLCVNQAAALRAAMAHLAGGLRTPLVFALHTTEVGSLRGAAYLALMSAASRFAAASIFISSNQQRVLDGKGYRPRRPVLIRNGLDAARFPVVSPEERASARSRFGFAPKTLALGLIGVFRPEKNHAQLVRVVAGLRREGHDVRLLLVGDGPTRPDVEALAQAQGVASEVIFTGMLTDVRPMIAAMDAGVICSVAIETLSIAALEILSCGVPMVMSDIGGAREIIAEGQNGYVFRAGDDVGLEGAILELCAQDRAQLGARAADIVRHSFTHDDMVEKYVSVFTAAAEKAPTARDGFRR
jgi:glycosyltransferase involved in cell wall biosynthesis